MLKIDIAERDGTKLVFILGGEIRCESLGELMSRWNEYRLLRKNAVCIVDVSRLSNMDSSGEYAILRIARDGARFQANGPMMERIIDLVCKANTEMLQEGDREFRSMVFCS